MRWLTRFLFGCYHHGFAKIPGSSSGELKPCILWMLHEGPHEYEFPYVRWAADTKKPPGPSAGG